MFSSPGAARSRSLVVECVGHTHATMYLDRPLTAADEQQLREIPQVLPLPVRLLRVQLRAVDANQRMMNALRDLVSAWRSRGNVHFMIVGGFPSNARGSLMPPYGIARRKTE